MSQTLNYSKKAIEMRRLLSTYVPAALTPPCSYLSLTEKRLWATSHTRLSSHTSIYGFLLAF